MTFEYHFNKTKLVVVLVLLTVVDTLNQQICSKTKFQKIWKFQNFLKILKISEFSKISNSSSEQFCWFCVSPSVNYGQKFGIRKTCINHMQNQVLITSVDSLHTARKVAGHKNSVSRHQSPPFWVHSATFLFIKAKYSKAIYIVRKI